ncbi:RNA-binding protein 44 [Clinocottus analis]|uniref:RNA-binding protein 44 n=1 Tax=Clinocottus analis TaxID=304258 RepID=UPI0035C07BA8
MAVYETGWPCWLLYCYGAQEYRKFWLERSLFSLVDGFKFLSLTDEKLLTWYLWLSSEDRRFIKQEYGGFQQFLLRHPSLELSQNHVYVKRYSSSFAPAQPTVTYNSPASVPQFTNSGAAECRAEMPGAHLDSERHPNNTRATSNPLGCSNCGGGPQKDPAAFSISTTQTTNHKQFSASTHLDEQRPLWPMSSLGAAVWKDPAAQSSFSLDVDLERHSRAGQPEVRSQTTITTNPWLNDGTCAEVSLLQSDCPKKDLSPGYHSFDSYQMDNTEFISVLDPVEESRTEECLQDRRVSGNEHTDGEVGASLSFGDQSDNFHSLADDKSVLFCLTGKDVNAPNDGAPSGSVCPNGGPDGDSAVGGQRFTKSAESSSSLKLRVTTCDVMVGSDVAPCTSAVTQTEGPKTADENINTEVYSSDLDYLVEEFTKLKMFRKKVRGQQEEIKSSGTKLRKECDCLQRAQRAELNLLALQYSMCRQYCWKLHCTSSEGGQLTSTTPENPSNIASVLQKLESDYNRMRVEIRAGVPLERLEPLSVDPESIATRPRYIPAEIISDVQGDVVSRITRSSQEPQRPKTSEENNCPNDQSSTDNEKLTKMETGRARRAVLLVPRDRNATHNAPKPEEKQTAACQELSTCEAWYDAEDGLHRELTGVVEDEAKDSSSEELKSSVLCVSNLPSHVTESDVMLWFEKHNPSEVSISALKNNLRVAIVTVSGPRAADAAVGELHGRCMQGRALNVEHINRAAGGNQRASTSGPESSKDSKEPPTSNTKTEPATRPLSSSLKNRRAVYTTPTAKGTFLPQHWGTMSSFDTLMAELKRRHPAVGRQRIVDALMELRVERGGALSGMPLRTIQEMASELLTRPAAATKL